MGANRLVSISVFLSLVITGCSSTTGGGIPVHSGSRPLQSQSGKKVLDKATVSITVYKCSHNFKEVATYYRDQLKGKPGWSQDTKGDEVAIWSNGNIQLQNLDDGKPKDPSKYGGHVGVYHGNETECSRIIIESNPK